jgi:NADPH2:quinone reductase
MDSAYWFFGRFGEAGAVMEQGKQDVPKPGPGQAIVAIRVVGLNQSENRYLLGTHFPPENLPSCLSHEAVGEIVELGPPLQDREHASRWKVGDRVAFIPMLVDRAGTGVLREFGVYDTSVFLPVPHAFSDREAAAYWMGILTMAGALDMAGLGPENCKGKTIVFTAAAGGMGTMGLKLASVWGAETIATTRTQSKEGPLRTLASQVAVVAGAEQYRLALQALYPAGVDAVIDPLGGDYVAASLAVIAAGGQFVSYEMITGTNVNYEIMSLMEKDASLHGYTFFRPLQHPGLLDKLINIGMADAGKLRPTLAENFSFDNAPSAFEALLDSEQLGKYTITL